MKLESLVSKEFSISEYGNSHGWNHPRNKNCKTIIAYITPKIYNKLTNLMPI
jgi:hypothetical protein